MTTDQNPEIHAHEKQSVGDQVEHTRTGFVFAPDVDIYETDLKLVLEVDMPGVEANDLSIDIHENTLTIAGEITPQEAPREQSISTEYRIGKYHRQFSVPELIDQANIEARLCEGVLQLTLPKVQKATPRKIQVRSE